MNGSADMTAAAAQLLGLPVETLRMALGAINAPKGPELMKIKTAALTLAVSEKTIYGWLADGKLAKVVLCAPHARRDGSLVGGRIAVRTADVRAIAQGGMAALESRPA